MFDWQLTITFCIIGWAIYAIFRRAQKRVGSTGSGCGSCSHCPNSSEPNSETLIELR